MWLLLFILFFIVICMSVLESFFSSKVGVLIIDYLFGLIFVFVGLIACCVVLVIRPIRSYRNIREAFSDKIDM